MHHPTWGSHPDPNPGIRQLGMLPSTQPPYKVEGLLQPNRLEFFIMSWIALGVAQANVDNSLWMLHHDLPQA